MSPFRSWLNAVSVSRAGLLLSGAALGFSLPPFDLSFLAWAGLVPLLVRWTRARTWRQAYLEAWVVFAVQHAIAFHWPLFHVFPGTALASLSGALALICYWPVPFALAHAVRQRLGTGPGLAALVGLFVLAETALRGGPFAMPWILLGHTQAGALTFIPFIDLTGALGLTVWVWLLNLAALVVARPGTRRQRHVALGVLAVLLAAPWSYGQLHRLPPPDGVLPAVLVQPALPALDWADVDDAARVDTLMALSETFLRGGPTPALVVWPETALPAMRTDSAWATLRDRLTAWTATWDTALLTGGILPAGDGPGVTNAAVLLQPDRPAQRYDKIHLVPFAEGVPLADRWPALARLAVPAGGVAGYVPGRDASPLVVGGVPLGVLICFESAFGNPARASVEQGAAFLVTLTQDGWWGPRAIQEQHLAFTRLRAIATRRAVVQVSVSGRSALVRADGSSAFEIGWMERAVRPVLVPLRSDLSFAVRYDGWLAWLNAAFVLLGGLAYALHVVRTRPSSRLF